jgi:hypothetical protein
MLECWDIGYWILDIGYWILDILCMGQLAKIVKPRYHSVPVCLSIQAGSRGKL